MYNVLKVYGSKTHGQLICIANDKQRYFEVCVCESREYDKNV